MVKTAAFCRELVVKIEASSIAKPTLRGEVYLRGAQADCDDGKTVVTQFRFAKRVSKTAALHHLSRWTGTTLAGAGTTSISKSLGQSFPVTKSRSCPAS